MGVEPKEARRAMEPGAPAEGRRPGRSIGVVAAGLVGFGLLMVGVLAARADVALLAASLLVTALWQSRPLVPGATVALESEERDDDLLGYRIRATGVETGRAVHLRLAAASGWHRDLLIDSDADWVHGGVLALHSGRTDVVSVQSRVVGPDAAWATAADEPLILRETVMPREVDLGRNLPLPSRLTGTTGLHPSSKPGDGGEFRDVHPFAPGDRLRRIDWRATARLARTPADLYVRRVTAQSDATVMVAVDTRDDLSGRPSSWMSPASEHEALSSLDLAREAATSLAAAYAHGNDRVGLVEVADHGRFVPPGSGRRHLEHLRRALASLGPTGTWARRVRAPILPTGALVYVLGTFLDQTTASLAVAWRQAGHSVIAIDVLPELSTSDLGPSRTAALQILRTEREVRFAEMRSTGIKVLEWRTPGPVSDRAVELQALAREPANRPGAHAR